MEEHFESSIFKCHLSVPYCYGFISRRTNGQDNYRRSMHMVSGDGGRISHKYVISYPGRPHLNLFHVKLRHQKYFRDFIEEELIAAVYHPRNYHKFKDLGFFD
jgi:hypothetical protein